LADLFASGNADVILVGHTHTYEHFRVLRSDGAGFHLINVSGRPKDSILWIGEADAEAVIFTASKSPGSMSVNMRASTLGRSSSWCSCPKVKKESSSLGLILWMENDDVSTPKREITLRFVAQPTDVNFGGKVHGGVAMRWLDQAGYVCASTWSGSYCVTAFVGDINFRHPVLVGELVEVVARVIRTGRTSMHILVNLHSCDPKHCEPKRAIRCIMVFVAVDESGSPIEVPDFEPTAEADIELQQYAERIMELRRTNQQQMDAL